MNKNDNKLIKNTSMLYVMNIAKMIFPLLTLPYLTRVLSVETYGVVSYVKAVMQYMQLIVDFGFMLSGTKDIVNARNDRTRMEQETGDILAARILLCGCAFFILCVVTVFIDILRNNVTYTMLSFLVVALTCFLFDYLFRGLEKMEVITVRFVVMRGIAALLTFVVVKDDGDILLIPILDIIGSVVACFLVWIELKKMKLSIRFTSFQNILKKITESAIYFFSSMATTAFMALNTVLIGIFIKEKEVAYWSLCLQMVTAVQSLYTPLTDGIYPHMVKSRDAGVLKKALKIYMPLVTGGCVFTLIVADYAVLIIGGNQYMEAAPILRCMVPVLFFSFPSMLFGWPSLGAIGKQKETTITTVVTAIVQVAGLVILILCDKFTLINIAILRGMTEALLCFLRLRFAYKFRSEFMSA